MDTTRQQALVDELKDAPGPITGSHLASRLGVSSRSVRNWVQEINRSADAVVITASRLGYELNGPAYAAWETRRRDRHAATTPTERLYYIARRLVTSADGEDVYDLADMLYVSDSTVEADLARVRVMLREFGLRLRRHRSTVTIEGAERDQRRLVRQLLLESAKGVSAAGMGAVLHEFRAYDLPALTRALGELFEAAELDVQEYALNDLALHLVIAVARIEEGHQRDAIETSTPVPEVVTALASDVAEMLTRNYGVRIPQAERAEIEALVHTRIGVGLESDETVKDPHLRLVQEALADIAERYLLDIDDPTFVVNLSRHVGNLAARAAHGAPARNPLKASFKHTHPLVHEIAVYLASRLEEGLQVDIDEDEIVFLALHVGVFLQRSLEAANRVRIACVVPRYYAMHSAFVDRIERDLGEDGTVVQTITTLHPDWDAIEADLVVTTIDPAADTPLPVVAMGLMPSGADTDRLRRSVREIQEAKAAARARWALSELLDPRLFVHVRSTSKDEALAEMCGRLADTGIVGPSFHEDVLERERLSPTAFGGSIAIPHSMKMDARSTAVSVLISDEPIAWAESSVHLVALFALSPHGRQMFRDTLDDLIATLGDPARIRQLIDASPDYDTFTRTLAEVLAG